VKSLDEAKSKITSSRTFLYLFLHKPGPRLEGNFIGSPPMQKISQELLVFVDITVEKSAPDKIVQLMKKCKVTKLPTAVIADQYGNPLFAKASTTNPQLLRAHVKQAQRIAEKMVESVDTAYEKARELCKTRKYLPAAEALCKIRKEGYVGLPSLEKVDKLCAQINTYLEKRLDTIQSKTVTEQEKKEALKALRAQAYKDLPVYEKIVAASREGTVAAAR
jgi:hypothetical protein